MEVEYMNLEEIMRESRQDGIEYGIELGRSEGIDIGRSEGIDIGRSEGIDIGRSEGIDIGRSEGIDIGRSEIITVIQRLKKGSTSQDLLMEGYPQELIDAALTCL
jgi:flagellar biosynthesis/type III secretory pathway protein FliH